MRFLMFLGGLAILALGVAAMKVLDKPESFAFLQGALTLGGGIVICGCFSGRLPWHALGATTVLSLLGACKGIPNLGGLPKYLLGDRSRGPAPVLESAVALICILLLVGSVRALLAERARRQLEELEKSDKDA